MDDRAFASATQLANEIRDRRTGCVELLDLYLARAERHNPALNAIVVWQLETAERVMARVSKTPRAKRSTSAAAAEAKASTASRGRGRPPKTATLKSARRKPAAPSLGERVLGLATGKTRQELYAACPSDRPNHVGMAVQRHIRAGRIQERDGKLYATSTATEQARGTA
jgi:hypothetical protein